MNILCLEDCENIVEISSLLWDMGWNNISGWICLIGDCLAAQHSPQNIKYIDMVYLIELRNNYRSFGKGFT